MLPYHSMTTFAVRVAFSFSFHFLSVLFLVIGGNFVCDVPYCPSVGFLKIFGVETVWKLGK
uniref:Uncharacterized protein n=1 Tax=Rhizophora mucronata TaxID=61149 RepID=A0A2P2JMW5_RHIMU